MKYAWYGKKFSTYLCLMILGAVIYERVGANWYLLTAIMLTSLVLGFAKETKSADGYWFKHNSKDCE